MVRTAVQTAQTLIQLYDDTCCGELFRIGWAQLRSLAGISKLGDDYLRRMGEEVAEAGYVLVPMDHYLIMADSECFDAATEAVPRVLERYLPEEKLSAEMEEDEEDEEVEYDEDEED